jgi:hypothetical protein
VVSETFACRVTLYTSERAASGYEYLTGSKFSKLWCQLVVCIVNTLVPVREHSSDTSLTGSDFSKRWFQHLSQVAQHAGTSERASFGYEHLTGSNFSKRWCQLVACVVNTLIPLRCSFDKPLHGGLIASTFYSFYWLHTGDCGDSTRAGKRRQITAGCILAELPFACLGQDRSAKPLADDRLSRTVVTKGCSRPPFEIACVVLRLLLESLVLLLHLTIVWFHRINILS